MSTDPRQRRASEVHTARHKGMDARRRAELNREFARADDLFTVCPSCGLRRTGRMDEVTAPCPKCRRNASGDTEGN